MMCMLQDLAIRPSFDRIKSELADIANDTFSCSIQRAPQMKRAKQQALLNQMLPAKVPAVDACTCMICP